MPLVEVTSRRSYLGAVVDVADIKALLIAGAYDPGGVLNGGVSGPQQNLIDKAKSLGG